VVFWGLTLLGLTSIIITIFIAAFGGLAYIIYFPLLVIGLILSWCREKFGSGQGSKVQAVLAGAAFPIVIMIGFIILLMVFGPKGRRPGYDADVKANLKNAATAQEAYFVDHDTYTL